MCKNLSSVPRPDRFVLYTSSQGNYFFHEIRDLIGAGLRELGLTVEFRNERDGFAPKANWHLVIAPHEFFELGVGKNLVSQKWPSNLILFNTEQPSSYWLSLSVRHFERAFAIWDIDFDSTLRICKRGYPCHYLPLGHVSNSPLLQPVEQMPLIEEIRALPAAVRDFSGFDQRFARRPIDLLFLGHGSPRREKYFARHAARLKNHHCFFHKPAATRPMIPGQTTNMNTLTSVGLSQRSKILLNLHHGVDQYFEWHRIVLLGIAQRTLVISEPCSIAPPFGANLDYVEAPLDEIPDRIEYFLGSAAGQAEAQHIIEHGYETLTTRCRLSNALRPLLAQLSTPTTRWLPSAARYFPTKTMVASASRPLSLCVVTPDVAGEGIHGDAGSAQVELAKTFAQVGHHVTLLHTEAQYGSGLSVSHWRKYFSECGIEYVPLPNSIQVPVESTEACTRAYETYLWLLGQSFDVVHIPETHGIGFYCLLAKKQGTAFVRTRFCLNAHGPRVWRRQASHAFVNNPYELELDFLEQECFRRADALVTTTQYLRGWLERQNWDLPAERQWRPNPLFSPDETPALLTRVGELVYLGPLGKCPGLATFCDALERLGPDALRKITITFADDLTTARGPRALEYLYDRTRQWTVKWQLIQAPPAKLNEYLKGEGRLSILPSPTENSPLIARRCLSLGVPFLAVSGGGLAELIAPAEHRQVFNSGTAAALVTALLATLKHPVAPARPVNTSAPIQAWLQWHQTWATQSAPEPLVPNDPLPLVSVCLIHFNRPELLTQALASLRAQDYPNFEVVLVDDGSTKPEALKFLASLEAEFKQRNWQIIRQENRYLGAARNTAARHARGEFIVFMDDDNIAKPHQLSAFVQAAQKTGAEIVTSAMDLFIGTEPPPAAAKPVARWIFLGPAAGTGAFRNCFGDANGCIRRTTFERLGGFSEDYGITHEDWEFYARAALHGCRMETLPEALFWYRVADKSMIRSTPVYANHQRSLRPYLSAVPAPLQGLIHCLQGAILFPAEKNEPNPGHENLLRMHHRMVSIAKDLLVAGQHKPAEAIFLEVLQSAETTQHPAIVQHTLLEIGRVLVANGQGQLASTMLEQAVLIARSGCDPIAIKEAETLLAEAKLERQPKPKPKARTPIISDVARQPVQIPAPNSSDKIESPPTPVAVLPGEVIAKPSLVSIIIPVFNNLPLTQGCLNSLARIPSDVTREIIVVDNASTDGTKEHLASLEKAGQIRVIRNPQNEGFARACNQGAAAATAEWLVFLNNDTKVTAGWIEALLNAADKTNAGIVGAKLLYADNTIQHAGIGWINGLPDHPYRHSAPFASEVNSRRELDMVTGACLLMERELFLKLAGFDEIYRNGVEDIDLCLRARAAGRKVVYEPGAVVYHLEGQSAGRFNHVNENLKIFFSRWGKSFDQRQQFIVPAKPQFIPASESVLKSPGSASRSESAAKAVVLSWEGSFLDSGSLSHVNRELTSALLKNSAGLRLQRVPNGAPATAGWESLAKELAGDKPATPEITVRHAWPPDWRRPRSGKLVVIQPWEFGSLPVQWVQQSAEVDEFWVPSEYVRRVYVDSGVPAQKVAVVANGINPDSFHPQAAPIKLATNKKFKFLFVGGTIYRKGPDLLLKAYLEQFTAADDVCLVIKDFGGASVYAGQTFEEKIRAAQAQPNAPEILYLNEELPPDALPGLYTACDCLVLPYRGEGFGLPALEAMACGLPVIVTAGGSTDDFVRDDFGWRIPAVKQVFGHEISGMKLTSPGWLLEPSLPALQQALREAFCQPEESHRRGQLAADYAKLNCSWQKTANTVVERCRALTQLEPVKATATKPSAPAGKVKITLPPCALLGHLGAAREHLAQKRASAAWSAARQAINVRPFHPEAYLLLAEIAQTVGNATAAKACAEHARSLAPGWKPAKKFLNQRFKGGSHPDWLKLPDAIQAGGKNTPKLSVCLIVKNEEKFLAQCLKSIRDLAAQIVVVDTGSTDRTVEIAREFNAEIHRFAWCDDFSAARNTALEHATGDWVLVLDADEELSAEGREKLPPALAASAVLAWRLPIIDIGREAEGCSYVPRLFRNAPGLFYLGRIHEQVFSSIEVRRSEWGLENRLGEATLTHYGYTAEITRDRNKVERNLKLLESAIEELPGEPHLLMNLGLELSRSGQKDAALARYREAFDCLASKPAAEIVPELRETLLTQYCTQLTAAQQPFEVVRILTSPLAKMDGGLPASLHFSLGLAHLELKQFSEAADQMRQCLGKRAQRSFAPINKEINTAAPHHCLAMCLLQTGDATGAEKAFQAGLKESGNGEALRLDYARFLAAQNQPVEALHRLNEIVAGNPQQPAAWLLGGQIALSQPEFLEFARDWTTEAMTHLPETTALQAQRAEALMLSENPGEALDFWEKVWNSTSQPTALAALILCQAVESPTTHAPQSQAEEEAASRAFINWYRRMLAYSAKQTVLRLNGQMDKLSRALPSAAKILETAFAEAAQTCVAP